MLDAKSCLASGALACALALVVAPSSPARMSARASAAKITVRPENLMVNSHTTAQGRGFPHNTVIALRECGRKFWIVPEDPCNTANAVSVKTDGRGRFTTTLRAEVCPEGAPGKAVTERTCYVGEPKASEDTVTLVGAAKLIVTYP